MSGSQILSCGKLQLLSESFRQIKKETPSCLTNFLTSSEEDSMVSRRIEHVLDKFYTSLTAACAAMPGVSFLVLLPMYLQYSVAVTQGIAKDPH